MTELADDIRQAIVVAAPIEQVWEVVSVPGWWIMDDTLTTHRLETVSGTEVIVHDPKWGAFPIGIGEQNQPTRASFSWVADDGVPALRVTFTLTRVDGGTAVDVHETGFAALSPAQHEVTYPGNLEGWIIVLKALSTTLT